MSLIQDALKRKAEETPAPEQIPEIKLSESPETPKGPQPLLIALIVLLIAALLVALGGLAFSLIRAATPSAPVKAPGTQTAAPAAATPQAIPSAPALLPPAIKPPEPAVPPAVDSAPIAVEPPVLEEWPELNLTGIASSGNQRIAIINGKMLTVGRRLGEVIVREVGVTRAIVEFRGEQRVLHVDE